MVKVGETRDCSQGGSESNTSSMSLIAEDPPVALRGILGEFEFVIKSLSDSSPRNPARFVAGRGESWLYPLERGGEREREVEEPRPGREGEYSARERESEGAS